MSRNVLQRLVLSPWSCCVSSAVSKPGSFISAGRCGQFLIRSGRAIVADPGPAGHRSISATPYPRHASPSLGKKSEVATELVDRARQVHAQVNPGSTWAVNGCTEMYELIPELIAKIEQLSVREVTPGGCDGQTLLAEILGEHRPYGLDCKCRRPINSDQDWAAHAAAAVDEGLRGQRRVAGSAEEVDPE